MTKDQLAWKKAEIFASGLLFPLAAPYWVAVFLIWLLVRPTLESEREETAL